MLTMVRSLILLLALFIIAGSCAYYPGASNRYSEKNSALSLLDSDLQSSDLSSQSRPADAASQRWITYGKTSYGDLRGFLMAPQGIGPFPALIFNHGSKQQVEPKREIRKFFNDLGFVVLLPHRRGYGNSAGPTLEEVITFDLDTNEGRQQLIDRLRKESKDVLMALSYMKSLPFVDSKRIIVSGHSFGGIATIYVAGKTADFVAGIVFATASGTWKHGGIYRQELVNAARQVKVPLLFIYAENDYDLSPGIVLSLR